MVPLKGQGDDIVNWRSEDSVTFHIFQAIDTRLKRNKRMKIKKRRKNLVKTTVVLSGDHSYITYSTFLCFLTPYPHIFRTESKQIFPFSNPTTSAYVVYECPLIRHVYAFFYVSIVLHLLCTSFWEYTSLVMESCFSMVAINWKVWETNLIEWKCQRK